MSLGSYCGIYTLELDSMLWLCVGDYNEILSSEEKQGGLPRPPKQMEDFRQALLHCGLNNLGFIGIIFTWRNGRPGRAFVQERLDRACANTEWREIYPFARVHHLHVAYSDHEPILIILQHRKSHRLQVGDDNQRGLKKGGHRIRLVRG